MLVEKVGCSLDFIESLESSFNQLCAAAVKLLAFDKTMSSCIVPTYVWFKLSRSEASRGVMK